MAGQRIDDHGSWVGARGKGVPLPEGSKMKTVTSAEGEGHIMDYSDTNEKIVRDQKGSDAKIRTKPMKPGYRY